MPPLVIMIDGLGRPPREWWDLIQEPLLRAGYEVGSYDRRDKALEPDVIAADNANRPMVLIPYSFGAEMAEKLSSLRNVIGVAMIDGVHEENEREPFNLQCPTAVAFTRRFIIGRAIGIVPRRGHSNVSINAGFFGHSRIVGIVAPRVVAFVNRVFL